ncbi:hypothetical protein CaCOL14_000108 [Colletotrichum acutatum]
MFETDSQTQLGELLMGQSLSLPRLSSLVLDVWLSVIQEKTWALNESPSVQSNVSVNSPLSFVGNLEEHRDIHWDRDDTNDCVAETTATRSTLDDSAAKDSRWNMERFLLNEERNRLCLWLSAFSAEELDRLINVPNSPSLHVFGIATLESFVRIGEALLKHTNPTNNSDYQLQTRDELRSMIQIGNRCILDLSQTLGSEVDRSSIIWDVSEGCSTASSYLSLVPGGSDNTLHSTLKSEIATLHELGYAIRRSFAERS